MTFNGDIPRILYVWKDCPKVPSDYNSRLQRLRDCTLSSNFVKTVDYCRHWSVSDDVADIHRVTPPQSPTQTTSNGDYLVSFILNLAGTGKLAELNCQKKTSIVRHWMCGSWRAAWFYGWERFD